MADKPFSLEIPYRDPTTAFGSFVGEPVAALLDGAAPHDARSRYAYIAADPYRVVTSDTGLSVDGTPAAGDPFTALIRELDAATMDTDDSLPPFQTGAVGFIGYEMGQVLERLPRPKDNRLDFPDMVVGFYDTIAAFDLQDRRAWIIASDIAPGRPSAKRRAAGMAARIADAEASLIDWRPRASWRAELERDDYEAMVGHGINYIHAGDIFQANLTGRFHSVLPADLSPWMLYRRLRTTSPAPFAAYLACGAGRQILSASPERFISLRPDGTVEARPIKGTRPRGESRTEDLALAQELVDSEKDNAENLMIVDLLRNDLSRASLIGSVAVPQLCALETFANVHHLVSVITSRLKPGLGPFHLIKAAFPGGSVTGAPKIRAMEIINELEVSQRGPYCGSVLWAGFDGAMDSSIIIRTIVISESEIVLQAGGGIVADSSSADEYEEALVKARSLMRCLAPAAAESEAVA